MGRANLTKKKEKHKCKKANYSSKRDDGPEHYVIYCIVNTSYFTRRGSLIASVARALLGFYNKLESDKAKSRILSIWEDTGEKLVILEGIDHKHLNFLAEDLEIAAVGTYALFANLAKNKVMLVFMALGKREDLEDVLEGLPHL